MIRKLLWAWLIVGTLLMVAGIRAGIAHGQVTYREGPFGGQRFQMGPQGVAGGCYVGPGGKMICGPNGCGSSSPTTGQVPARTAPRGAGMPSPVVVAAPARWAAVCVVTCDDGGGTRSLGSGVLVGVHPTDDVAAVLTCWHTFRDQKGEIHVFIGGGKYAATLKAKDPDQDIALLWIRRPRGDVKPLPLAKHDPGFEDPLWSMGYESAS